MPARPPVRAPFHLIGAALFLLTFLVVSPRGAAAEAVGFGKGLSGARPDLRLSAQWDLRPGQLLQSGTNRAMERLRAGDMSVLSILRSGGAVRGTEALAASPTTLSTQNDVPREDLWEPDAPVIASVLVGDTLYIGGSFQSLGMRSPHFAVVDSVSGDPQSGFPQVDGLVDKVVPDGSGGWYIGGSFSTVGGLPRAGLAHILSDMSVSPWNPNATPGSAIADLAVSGGLVYAAGAFSTIGGQSRAGVAALDATTGLATSWNAGVNNDTCTVVRVSGGIVYVAGAFTTAGGTPRAGFAAFDAGTGLLTSFDPAPDGQVLDIEVDGGTVYACGAFTAIGGESRHYIAALDAGTGLAATWAADADSFVVDVEISGGTVYAGGFFQTIGGATRTGLAALDAVTGAVQTWNPAPSFDGNPGSVLRITVDGGLVYVSGVFLNIGGQTRLNIAALDAGTGLATPFFGLVNGNYPLVLSIAPGRGTVALGGPFRTVGLALRQGLAAIDVTTGAPTSWAPVVDHPVSALAVSGGTVYAGGAFTGVAADTSDYHNNLLARHGAAAFDAVTGVPTGWDPAPDSLILTLAVDGGTVYAGGSFREIGGQPRDRIAALDATTGAATAWNPQADYIVDGIEVVPGGVVACGSFTTIGGQTRWGIAALDATGAASAWNPTASAEVSDTDLEGQTLYVGGFFTTIGGQPRSGLAAFDVATGLLTDWNPGSNGAVFRVKVNGPVVYAGGGFTEIGGQTHDGMAAIEVGTGAVMDWTPNLNYYPTALSVGGGDVYLGGSFTSVGGESISYLAGVPEPSLYSQQIIQPVAVVATSQWGGDLPDGRVGNLIDGSGLSGVGPVEQQTHDNDPNAATMWHAGDIAAGIDGGITGNPPPVDVQAVDFDLGANYDILGAYIWNQNQAGLTTRGVNEFEVYVSDQELAAPELFTYVGTFHLAEAGGGAEHAQFIPFPSTNVRSVAFNINSAWSGLTNDYVGLSEVRLVGSLGTTVSAPNVPAPQGVSVALANAGLNPGTRLSYRITLPDAGPRRLEVFDVAGRRLFSRDVGTLGPGTHVVNVEGVAVAPGLYLARLRGGKEGVSVRSVIVR